MDLAFLAVTVLLLLCGFPVAFTLGGVAVLFAGFIALTGETGLIALLPARIYGSVMTNETLVAIPLFILMGMALERGRVAEDAFAGLTQLMGDAPRGMMVAVLLVGTLLAASTGIVGATVTTLGLIALPALLKRGVPDSAACGTVCAAGTLGQIIPPSIALVILGDQISNAYAGAQTGLQQAAWASGEVFTPRSVSVGDLFAGALGPGLLLAGIYIAYTLLMPMHGTAPPPSEPSTPRLSRGAALRALLPPLALIIAVLGTILSGIAPPSEAAGIGAIGALFLAATRVSPSAGRDTTLPLIGAWLGGGTAGVLTTAFWLSPHTHPALPFLDGAIGAGLFGLLPARRAVGGLLSWIGSALLGLGALAATLALVLGKLGLPVLAGPLALFGGIALIAALFRLYRAEVLRPITEKALGITAMVFAILIGASAFGIVFRDLGGDETVRGFLDAFPGGADGAVLAVLGVMILLGLFLDFVEITLIVVPIAAPILLAQPQIDPIWLGVMMALALQTSFMTPPLGYALFYLRGVAPETVPTGAIYRGALPFVGLQICALAIVWFWQDLATWLPIQIFGL